MKYFNIKRYKFSTITRTLSNLSDDILDYLKFINLKKIYKYFEATIYKLTKTFKYLDPRKYYLDPRKYYLDPRKYNVINYIKKIKIKSNKFLFFHLPISIIFFAMLYFLILYAFFYFHLSRAQL